MLTLLSTSLEVAVVEAQLGLPLLSKETKPLCTAFLLYVCLYTKSIPSNAFPPIFCTLSPFSHDLINAYSEVSTAWLAILCSSDRQAVLSPALHSVHAMPCLREQL